MNWNNFIIFLISIINLEKIVLCQDYFTSIVGLEKLLEAEAKLIDSYESALNYLEDDYNTVTNFIAYAADILENTNDDFYENPITAYKMLRRIVKEWGSAENMILMNHTDLFESASSYGLQDLALVPSAYDVTGSAKGIALLQNTYKLKTEDLVAGKLASKNVSTPLTAHDCYIIGEALTKSKEKNLAVEWLLKAKHIIETDGEETDANGYPYVSEEDILHALTQALIIQGNFKLAARLNYKLTSMENENAAKNDELISKAKIQQEQIAQNFETWQEESIDSLFMKVCNGEVKQTPREKRELRCRYLCHVKPDCLISPFRFEEHSLDPYIGVFYDVIYESEIQFISNKTKPKLQRSKVGGHEDFSAINDIRTSKNTWLPFHLFRPLHNLAKRLEHFSGLSLKYAEDLQVVNYGVGGYYSPHLDYLPPLANGSDSFPTTGNRIATALFYMNDVEMGGGTAFPFLKIAVSAQKGSALLWFNQHYDLEPDHRTWHTGCPVIKGYKWVANEWFHAFGQEFTRPCLLKPDFKSSIQHVEEIFEFEAKIFR